VTPNVPNDVSARTAGAEAPGSTGGEHAPTASLSTPVAAASTFPDAARQRLVLAVFRSAIQAGTAVAALASGAANACHVLMVSEAEANRDADTAAPIETDACVIVHHVDAPGTLATMRELSRSDMLSNLWDNMVPRAERGRHANAQRMQDLFLRVVHHLADGATVVIIHAPDPERQLLVSRSLLASKCEVLLTHEALQTENCATSAIDDEESCCETCTQKSCGRFDPA
jgi:hypothetical protein